MNVIKANRVYKNRVYKKLCKAVTGNVPHLPLLLMLAFLFLGPLGVMVHDSFCHYDYAKPRGLGSFIGFQNYSEVFHEEGFWQSVIRLFVFVVITLPTEVLLGLILAHVLKNLRYPRPVLSILLIPTMAAPVVVGLLGRFLFNNSFGIVPYVIEAVFGVRPKFLSDPTLAFITLAAIEIWHWTPLLALIFYSGLISLPQDPYDAAKVDGASSLQIFRFVTLPLLMPVIIAGTSIRGIDLFKIFDEILVMTGGGPGTATEVLNYYVYKTAFRSWNIGNASAIGVLMIVILVPVVYVFYKMTGGGRT